MNRIPLNCVDKCLLALDRIGEPMLIHAIVELDGSLDPDRLRQAIRAAQRAHPVMATVVRAGPTKTFRAIPEDIREDVLTVADLSVSSEDERRTYLRRWMNRSLDPRRQWPLRALLVSGDGGSQLLVFTFHHTATDGLRAVLFVRTIFESYNGASPETSPSLAEVRGSRQGDELLEFAHSQRSRVEGYRRRMVASLFRRFAIGFFRPPARVFHDRSGRSRELDLVYATLQPNELDMLVHKAAEAGAELNDLLLAACCRTVEEWNRVHERASNRIRIMAPVNISPKGFRNIVSNQASWLSITTTPAMRADPATLLRAIRERTVSDIRDRIPFSLVYFFYFCSRFPLFIMRGMCVFLMLTRTYVDTILITNLGLTWPRPGNDEPAITRIGDARIINATGSAPVVTPMGLSISVGIYNRRLNISLTYRTAMFSAQQAESFLDMYVRQVRTYPVG